MVKEEEEGPGSDVEDWGLCHQSCVCLVLFYAIATVFQSFQGGDMMYEMRRKPEPTPSPTQGIYKYESYQPLMML